MQIPTAAPIVEVMLGGEARTLKYGFRAYKELGLNPFDPASIEEFQSKPSSIDTVAAYVRAGLLHEYARGGARFGQEPPTAEDVIDMLDMFSFVDLSEKLKTAMGIDKPVEPSENPPNA